MLEQLRNSEIVLRDLNACTERLAKEQALDSSETETWKIKLQLETERTNIANQRADLNKKEMELEKQRADFYEDAYTLLTKKHGAGCFFAKLFTAWIYRCK